MSQKSERKKRIKAEKLAAVGMFEGTAEGIAQATASGETEMAQHEINYIQRLLDEHGCPETCEIITSLGPIADIAHKGAHARNLGVKQTSIDIAQTAALEVIDVLNKHLAVTKTESASICAEVLTCTTRRLLLVTDMLARQAMGAMDEANGRKQPSLVAMPTATKAVQ